MLVVDHERCDRCGICVSICPTAALRLVNGVTVDRPRCIACGQCVVVCPFGALMLRHDHQAPEAPDA